jgi:hypothetical protein
MKRESATERYMRIVAEQAAKRQQKPEEKIRVSVEEDDPVFTASPAAHLDTRDVKILKSLPQIISQIEMMPGPQGETGERGPSGQDGKDGRDGSDGKEGRPGKDGKDASVSFGELKGIANSSIKTHEDAFDHSKIDPFLLGTKKVSEAGMEDGQVLTYSSKKDKLIYTTIKQVAAQIAPYVPRGSFLPNQTGQTGKFLKTVNGEVQWATVSGSGDVVGPASATDNNFAAFDLTTGKLIKDSTYSSASFAAALGADDNYVTDAEKTVIGNTSGTNTGDQSLFRTIAVSGQSDVVADSTTDTLTLVAGNNIEITTNATTDTITITGTGAGGSGITRSVNVITTNTSAGATAATDYVYVCQDTLTLTMPTAVGNTNRYTIKNLSEGVVTVVFNGSETADASTSLSLNPLSAVDLISDNSNYSIT